MKSLLKKLYNTNSLDNDELLYLLDNMNVEYQELLFYYANNTRIRNYGKKVYIRGLVEFSSYCKNTCKYCGIRCENKKADRYRMELEEIIKCCNEGNKLDYKTFVLQSGEDAYYTDDLLVEIVLKIKSCFPNSAVTLSIGEKSYLTYKKLFNAGVDRYLLRHETASKELYKELHPRMSFENRMRCLNDLKDIGYQVGAGFIVGLPNQTNEVLVKDLLYLKKLEPEMVGIGPLIIHPDTPLRNFKCGSLSKTFTCLALTRLLLPDVLLPATTALNVVDPNGWGKALKVGANVIMLNLSPGYLRKKYELYKGKAEVVDEAIKYFEEVKEIINKAGYEMDMSRGDHKRWKRKEGICCE
ncbi:[FeFe] hydrogenase H-cluster radical SAM maturase HydE [Sedimentibacter sp. zth1]|uniref:[FeFe] hydrogenase H-cluster radical SAM maturase HydE n=1 Tax=Sedimentibacter sp. zth1 TaxID=2816908 RepID=UPI001A939B25|nr:[FeFe] hydrogenase H-cluster radical SAM maturase HydE [Sedimentibacter sp. zth1]QSX06307.1 [FeFe] hydrogenase H-cluster radical SAM maturase HydE [Sedimentibacter sp. zth1]